MSAYLRLFAIISIACGMGYTARAAYMPQDPAAAGAGTGSIAGRVILNGKPSPGVAVVATAVKSVMGSDPAERFRQLFEKEATYKSSTDQDGTYRITGVPAGRYQVTVYAPSAVQYRSGAPDDGRKDVTLLEGEQIEGIDFKLEPGGVITGTVTDQSGRPLIREVISLSIVGESGKKVPFIRDSGDGNMFLTDDRGIYRIYGLPKGRYLVSAGGSDQVYDGRVISNRRRTQRTFYPGVTDESKAKSVEVAAGAEVSGIDIKLAAAAKGFTAIGRVIDGQSGKPLPNMLIHYNPAPKDPGNPGITASPPGTTASNAEGEFRLENLQPGTYMAGVFFTGQTDLYSENITFEMKDGDLTGLEIKLLRGGSIQGIVTVEGKVDADVIDSLGNLQVLATVTNTEGRAFSYGRGMINPDGSFRITGLGPGVAQVVVTDDINSMALSQVRIERDGVEQLGGIKIGPAENISGVRIVMAPSSGSIRGRVILQNGPLPPDKMLLVSANLEGGGSGQFHEMSEMVQPDGSFVLSRLVPGNYELEFTLVSRSGDTPGATDGPLLKQVVTVSAGGATDVTVTISLKENDRER